MEQDFVSSMNSMSEGIQTVVFVSSAGDMEPEA
jgi:hypothetical protein